MAARQPGLTEQIAALVMAINVEKDKLAESLETIQEHSENLRRLAADAQQRLIGRS
jgi:hypothetical protein